MKNYILQLIFLILVVPLWSQEYHQDTDYSLSSALSGSHIYEAFNTITLGKGFSFDNAGESFTADVNKKILFPDSSALYMDDNGNLTSDPTQGYAVGAIPGQFNVSPTGAATYTIPIEVPPGVNGMQPSIALSYNSQAGNGTLGLGWNISGASAISRVPKTQYHNNRVEGVKWNSSDALALDGNRLIAIQSYGTDGKDSVEYRTEVDNGSKIMGYDYNYQGPASLKVWTKDGKEMCYDRTVLYKKVNRTQKLLYTWYEYIPGENVDINDVNTYTNNGTFEHYIRNEEEDIWYLSWNLSKVADQYGNFIEYEYAVDSTSSEKNGVPIVQGWINEPYQGTNFPDLSATYSNFPSEWQSFITNLDASESEVYHAQIIEDETVTSDINVKLKHISYGHKEKVLGRVDYHYSIRNKKIDYYYAGYHMKEDARLYSISVNSLGANGMEYQRGYSINYKPGEDKIQSISLTSGGEKIKATCFSWGERGADISQKSISIENSSNSYFTPEENKFENKRWASVDLNNDGLQDLMATFNYNYEYEKDGGVVTVYLAVFQPYWAEKDENGNLVFKEKEALISGSFRAMSGDHWTSYVAGGITGFFSQGNKIEFMLPKLNKTGGICQMEFHTMAGEYICQNGAGIDHGYYNLKTVTDEMPAYSVGDFNSDGFSDIVFIEKHKKNGKYPGRIVFGGRKVTNYPWPSRALQFDIFSKPERIVTADFNNDGALDIMVLNSRGHFVYSFQGNKENGSFSRYVYACGSELKITDTAADLLNPGDFNGDGAIDFLFSEASSNSYYFAMNDGAGEFNLTEISNIGISDSQYEKKTVDDIVVTDFNNDGKSDLIVLDHQYLMTPQLDSSYELISVEGEDANGYLNLLYSHNGFDYHAKYDYEEEAYEICRYETDDEGTYPVDVSWVSRIVPMVTKSAVHYMKAASNGISTYKTITSTEGKHFEKDKILHGDFDGDGNIELLSLSGSILGNLSFENNSKMLESFAGDSLRFNKVYSLTDAMQRTTEIDYSTLAIGGIYTPTEEYLDAYRSQTIPLNVVRKVEDKSLDGNIQNYLYKGAVFSLNRNSFIGFRETELSNELTDARVVTKYEKTDVYTQMPSQKDTYSGTINTSSCEYIYDIVKPVVGKNLIYQARMTSNIEKNKLNGAGTRTTYSNYDTYGNPRLIETEYYDGDAIIAGRKKSVTSTFVDTDGDAWHRILPSKIVEKMEADNKAITSTKDYIYNPDGSLYQMITDKDSTFQVNTSYLDYDEYGNALTIEVDLPNNTDGIEPKYTDLEYCGSGRFLKSKTTDNLTTSYTYDTTRCLLLSETAPTGLSTYYYYNGLGQRYKTHTAGGLEQIGLKKWAKGDIYAPVGALYYKEGKTSGQAAVKVYYDATGRELRTLTRGFQDEYIYQDKRYNELGQVDSVSFPYFDTDYTDIKWTSYEYDYLGRVVKSTAPDGTISETFYTDAERKVTTKVKKNGVTQENERISNALGQVETSKDNAGDIVHYNYDYAGRLKESWVNDLTQHKTTFTYDSRGNRLSISDPDAGTISNTYDALGRMLTQTNAQGHYTTYTYDDDGRLHTQNTRQSVGGAYLERLEYIYQNSGAALGQVNRIKQDGITKETYSYDHLGRMSAKTEYVDAQSFTHSHTYDDYGRMATLRYPSGYELSYQYTVNGDLDQIKHDYQVLYKNMDYSAIGALEKYRIGPKLVTRHYDEIGRLDYQGCGSEQSSNYAYDDMNNLEYRKDDINNQEEYFSYDNLNRLKYTYSDAAKTQQTEALIYSETGNILSKTGVASGMVYGENGKPHALTSIGTPTGYQPPRQHIDYTYFNKVKSIDQNDGDYTYDYTYGRDHQRRKTVYKENGVLKRTKYYLGNYEKVIDADGNVKEYHYLSADCGMFGIFVRTNGGSVEKNYILTDHLGSLTKVLDAGGNLEQSFSYDAWGDPRSSNDWTENAVNQLLADRGFTGHEHLPTVFGLIDMNGRMYDPVLGRFLSPDPYVQSPDYAQNFNRYAYCLNNPLIYTDPDGEFFTSLFLGPVGLVIDAALWSGTINLVSNWNNIDNFGEGLAAFGAGAAQGALTVTNPALGSIVGGALTNATNSAIGQMGSWDEFGSIDFGAVGTEALIGGTVGAVGYGTGKVLQKTNLTNTVLDKIGASKQGVRNILGQGISGTIAGTTTGIADGLARGAVYGEWNQLGERIWKGGAYGGAGGLVYGSVNQLGFEIYKRTGDRKYFDAGGSTGKALEQGVNASKQPGQETAGAGSTPYGINENSITVSSQKNGINTVTISIPNPIHGAVPTVSQYTYYNPSLYRSVNIYSLFRIR